MYYTDQMMSQDINNYLPLGKYLWLVIDTCFSGGILNLFQLDQRLRRYVMLYAGANSEIYGWALHSVATLLEGLRSSPPQAATASRSPTTSSPRSKLKTSYQRT